ncbi:MAG: hypothetical protein KDC87_09635, partial [Planctomycetes bacterium]|nr:hypothetical protein [Planctomycetota bacterium]
GSYAGRLLQVARTSEPGQLLDRLLCAAVIEGRSCERLKLLAGALERAGDDELSGFYRGLVQSEARHYRDYVEFARRIFGADAVRVRLPEICAHEAEVLAAIPGEARMHSGRLAAADDGVERCGG